MRLINNIMKKWRGKCIYTHTKESMECDGSKISDKKRNGS